MRISVACLEFGTSNYMKSCCLTTSDSQDFWDDLLANKTKDGMMTYEMDWMNDQMHQSKSMLTNATLGRRICL